MSNLKAIKRENTSSGSNNKLRSEGLIPAILYGGKEANKNIPLDIRLDYIRFKNGLKLPKPRRDAVKKQIAEIIKEHKLDG